MGLNKNILNARENVGLTRSEFATKVNVDIQTVENWECGKEIPNQEKLVQISEVLGVPVDILVSEDSADVIINVNEKAKEVNNTSAPEVIEYEMDSARLRLCKIWLIIGAVITPLVSASSYIEIDMTYAIIMAIVSYAFSIPLLFVTLHFIKKAKTKNQLIPWGIVSLICVSLIGGILILSSEMKQKKN